MKMQFATNKISMHKYAQDNLAHIKDLALFAEYVECLVSFTPTYFLDEHYAYHMNNRSVTAQTIYNSVTTLFDNNTYLVQLVAKYIWHHNMANQFYLNNKDMLNTIFKIIYHTQQDILDKKIVENQGHMLSLLLSFVKRLHPDVPIEFTDELGEPGQNIITNPIYLQGDDQPHEMHIIYPIIHTIKHNMFTGDATTTKDLVQYNDTPTIKAKRLEFSQKFDKWAISAMPEFI